MNQAAEMDCRACRLDYLPGTYVDASWLSLAGDAELLMRVRATPRAQPFLSRYLLMRLELQTTPSWRREDDPLGLALMAPAALCDLILKAGACSAAEGLRALVSGANLRRLLDDIGPDAYCFGVRHGPTLAERHHLAAHGLISGHAHGSAVRAAGMGLLAAATASMDHHVTRRMLLKLPRRWGEDFRLLQPTVDRATTRALLADIVQEDDDAPHDS